MSENQNIRLKVLPTTFMLEAENYKFDVHVAVHRDKFLIIKPTRCTNFSKVLFWNETLHVLESSSVHHQEFSTVHTAVGISHRGLLTACEQEQMLLLTSCQQTSVYSAKLLMMDRGTV